MRIRQQLTALRKFISFVSMLYPRVSAWMQRGSSRVRAYLVEGPTAPVVRWVGDLRMTRAIRRVVRRFAWRNYEKKHVDWSQVPQSARVILRPVFLLTLALIVLMPFATLLKWPALVSPAFDNEQREVAGWSALLWLAALPVAWATLMAGAATANRFAHLLIAAVVAFLFLAISVPDSRDWWGAGPGIAILLSCGLAGLARPGRSRPRRVFQLTSTAGVAAAGGFLLFALTPLHSLSLSWLLIATMVIGASLFAVAQWLSVRLPGDAAERALPAYALVATLLIGIYLGSRAFDAGLASISAEALSAMDLLMGYLWPAWYFIGVGIVHKLLKHSQVVSDAIGDLVSERALGWVLLAVLLVATPLAWSSSLISESAWPVPSFVQAGAAYVYMATRAIWAHEYTAMFMTAMRWIFLPLLVLLIYQGLRRQWTTRFVGSCAYGLVVASFFVYEYLFEFFAFTRSPQHSFLIVFLFAAWVLWLVYTVGLELSMNSTPAWPSPARFGLFSGALVVMLSVLHGRTAIGDIGVRDEIYLFLFRGVTDVGLPYLLYVLAQRRLGELPLALHRVVLCFLGGAGLSGLVAILDKIVIAGGWNAAWELAGHRVAELSESSAAFASELPDPPVWWELGRAAGILTVLLLLGAAIRRLVGRDDPQVEIDAPPSPRSRSVAAEGSNPAMLFGVVAIATGFVSFSRTTITLPFATPRWMVLVSAWTPSPTLSVDQVVSYLAWLFPCVLVVVALRQQSRSRGALVALSAFVVHLGIQFGWRHGEPWLRGTAVLIPATILMLVTFVALFNWLLPLREMEAPVAAEAEPPVRPSRRGSRLLLGAVALVALAAIGIQAHRTRLVPHFHKRLGAVSVPAWWTHQQTVDDTAIYTIEQDAIPRPMLTLQVRALNGQDSLGLLEQLIAEGRAQSPDVRVHQITSWDRYQPNSHAVHFSLSIPVSPGAEPTPIVGTTAVAARDDESAFIVGIFAPVDRADELHWDTARIVQALSLGSRSGSLR